MKFPTTFLIVIVLSSTLGLSQTSTLSADGPGNTYELIDNILIGPDATSSQHAYEVPDCGHTNFGRHIDEVYDTTLQKYVFQFYSHLNEDDDRCINSDRQRTEIKTYDPSLPHLKGDLGDTHTYTWSFYLDPGFQVSSSFCHLFQIKAKGGDDSLPIITITTKYTNGSEQAYIGYQDAGSGTLQKFAYTPLTEFVGKWINVTCNVTYAEQGHFDLTATDLSGNVIMQYSNTNIDMWRDNALFNRPKWGIYRKIVTADLRDEVVKFADFTISEGAGSGNIPPATSITSPADGATFIPGSTIAIDAIASDADGTVQSVEFYVDGTSIGIDTSAPYSIPFTVGTGTFNLTTVATDDSGANSTSATVSVTGQQPATTMHISSVFTGTQSAGKGKKNGTATITVLDTNSNFVDNVSVIGTFTGTFNETVTGVTGTDGTVTLITSGSQKGSVVVDLCVDNMSHSTLTYQPSDNVMRCSNGSKSASFITEETFGVFLNTSTNMLSIKGFHGMASIFDIHGRSIITMESSEINVSNLSAGLYIVRQNDEMIKFVKK